MKRHGRPRPSLARRRSSREMYEDGTFPRPFGCRLLGLGTPLQGRAAAAPAAAAAEVVEEEEAAEEEDDEAPTGGSYRSLAEPEY